MVESKGKHQQQQQKGGWRYYYMITRLRPLAWKNTLAATAFMNTLFNEQEYCFQSHQLHPPPSAHVLNTWFQGLSWPELGRTISESVYGLRGNAGSTVRTSREAF